MSKPQQSLTISFLRKASCVSRFVVLRPLCGDWKYQITDYIELLNSHLCCTHVHSLCWDWAGSAAIGRAHPRISVTWHRRGAPSVPLILKVVRGAEAVPRSSSRRWGGGGDICVEGGGGDVRGQEGGGGDGRSCARQRRAWGGLGALWLQRRIPWKRTIIEQVPFKMQNNRYVCSDPESSTQFGKMKAEFRWNGNLLYLEAHWDSLARAVGPREKSSSLFIGVCLRSLFLVGCLWIFWGPSWEPPVLSLPGPSSAAGRDFSSCVYPTPPQPSLFLTCQSSSMPIRKLVQDAEQSGPPAPRPLLQNHPSFFSGLQWLCWGFEDSSWWSSVSGQCWRTDSGVEGNCERE